MEAVFNRGMAELAHKSQLEQQKLEALQKQVVLEEERLALQKL
jgi:hypothetical protein